MGDGFMGTKGMLQLCTPFVTAVVVIISFYMLGGVYLLLGLLLDELGLYIGYDEVFSLSVWVESNYRRMDMRNYHMDSTDCFF